MYFVHVHPVNACILMDDCFPAASFHLTHLSCAGVTSVCVFVSFCVSRLIKGRRSSQCSSFWTNDLKSCLLVDEFKQSSSFLFEELPGDIRCKNQTTDPLREFKTTRNENKLLW